MRWQFEKVPVNLQNVVLLLYGQLRERARWNNFCAVHDWLPSGQDWVLFPARDYACPARKISPLSFEIFQNIFCDNYSAFTATGATQTMKTMQSDSRIETIDSNIFKSSQSHVLYKTMKSQLVLCDACGTTASRIHTIYWSSLPRAFQPQYTN